MRSPRRGWIDGTCYNARRCFPTRSVIEQGVRGSTKNLSKCLALLIGLAFFAPVLQCGAGLATANQTMACCRAMKDACHKMSGDACCHHRPDKLSPMISAPPAQHFSGVQPAFTAALLPATGSALPVRPLRCFAPSSVSHSPPGSIPLFLFHSTLLI